MRASLCVPQSWILTTKHLGLAADGEGGRAPKRLSAGAAVEAAVRVAGTATRVAGTATRVARAAAEAAAAEAAAAEARVKGEERLRVAADVEAAVAAEAVLPCAAAGERRAVAEAGILPSTPMGGRSRYEKAINGGERDQSCLFAAKPLS